MRDPVILAALKCGHTSLPSDGCRTCAAALRLNHRGYLAMPPGYTMPSPDRIAELLCAPPDMRQRTFITARGIEALKAAGVTMVWDDDPPPTEEQIAGDTLDTWLGVVTVAVGAACVIAGTFRWHASMPLWSYGLALVLVGALLVQAGRR